MERKTIVSFFVLSSWLSLLLPVAGTQLAEVQYDLLGNNRAESVDKRSMLEKRACQQSLFLFERTNTLIKSALGDPGFFSCGNGYCAPNGGTCCANGYYADPGWYCCPDNSGYSAPNGAICCPGTGYFARPGYYCCSDFGSCQNGETCLGCTPMQGESGSAAPPPATSSTPQTTAPPAPPATTLSPVYEYYTFTIT